MKFKKFFAAAMAIFFLIAAMSANVEASVINLPSKKNTAQTTSTLPKPATQTKTSTPQTPQIVKNTAPAKKGEADTGKASVWQPEIRIGLFSGASSVKLQMSEPCVMINPDTKAEIKKIGKDEVFTITPSSMSSSAVEIRGASVPLKDLLVTINGKKYFGGVRVNKVGGGLTVINLVAVEEYLRGVLPSEMIPSFHPEALKAQAVAARAFTLKNINRHAKDGYDLCATTHCQKYDGATNTQPSTDKAVRETRGEVLYYQGACVDTNFHTDSGGMTENVVDVWGQRVPYLLAVKELETGTKAWNVKISVQEFSSRMGSAFGNLQAIHLSKMTIGKSANDRTSSGRVKFVELVGSGQTIKMNGTDLRIKFSLPSTLFDMKLEGGMVIFSGFGGGHGVGMSQCGAQAYANAGWKYEKILTHYYTGTELKKLY